MLKKYLDGKIVDWETIEICPHPPPTDPPQARQNAVAKREFTVVEGGVPKSFFPICPDTNRGGSHQI